MPVISSLFLVIALVLAVVIGPQTRPWTWGPAMLALGCSVLAALPVMWKRGKAPADFGMLTMAALTAAWFAWRAWTSPVEELGQADLLLVAGAVGAFVSIRSIAGHPVAERVLGWGIALLLLASLIVIGKQLIEPGFSPVFRLQNALRPTGFFAHYNVAANYLIASSMLVAAAALSGRHGLATRILWALLAIAGLAAVWFTRSRGGIFGAAAACGVLAVLLLVLGKRRNAKWFGPAVIAVPVIGLGISAFLFMGWQSSQETRGAASQGLDGLMDNTIRLYLLGIAIQCIGLHPLAGGGSRSFSWECFRFWDKTQQGAGGSKPELVHNEFLQSATDYGLVGTGLLVGLLGALALAAILRIMFEETDKDRGQLDAWRIGALAALAGMLVQSCFSFVFHLMPGILLLGICLGQMSRTSRRSPGPRTLGARVILSLAALTCAILLLPAGWKGLRVTRILWPAYFSKQNAVSAESKIDALTEAIRLWPLSTFHRDRAGVFQELALAAADDPHGFRESAERAAEDYQLASLLHPFDPGLHINRANLLSQLERDAEAEEAYARTIALQGGMEPAFRGHFSLANHYLRKGLRLIKQGAAETALDALEQAAIQMEEAVKLTPPWVINVSGRNTRIAIHESLGTAREAAGDPTGALESYNLAASLHGGRRAHYRAGVLIGKSAVEAWSARKPSEALADFMDARQRIRQAGNDLPEGVTPSQRAEYIDYLDRTIQFLKGAKVEPAK